MRIRVVPPFPRAVPLALVTAVCALTMLGVAAIPRPIGAQPAPVRSGAAPRTFTITGVVRDSASGEVLPNARVGLVSSPRAIQTNADGRFALLGVPGDPQTLRVQYVGYASRLLALRADTVTGPLSVILTKAVVRLSTATVRSATDQSATVVAIGRDVSVQSISTAQVEAMPSIGEADVFRTLQMLPSVAGAGNGGASLSVRGGTPDHGHADPRSGRRPRGRDARSQ